MNTRTCLTDPGLRLDGVVSHEQCGPDCPGPDSEFVQVRLRLEGRVRAGRRRT